MTGHSKIKQSPSLASWSDENGAIFVLSNASAPIPETRLLPVTSELQKVYDTGDASAVWRVGEAFIKLKDLITPNATREHATLQYLQDKHPLDFNIPEAYYYADLGKRYLIILG
ncbi:hypothetical protein PMAA_033040 [Talaromyces marneffei ATCC 18224]|uniref:Uncharacterized protein n=1 Tax=Talaromyces marneffei (strain ATCC 18224 / CBS 334.59 / QM 7333) TaxID=441960 RepID=B6Q5V8_TALMQ|nr:hypothetical protein PMAA_033040 [Talaromyces marneffei ATCC 18224]